MHPGGVVQDELGTTRGIMKLDNGFVIRHVTVIRSFLQGLRNIVTKYAKTVSGDAVAPMLEAHIVQTLFLQKKIKSQDWEGLCFLQSEVIQLEK